MKTLRLLLPILWLLPTPSGRCAPAEEGDLRPSTATCPSAEDLLDSAIRRALRWLAGHQAPDGAFRPAASPDRPGDAGLAEFETATTGLGILVFTGRRITHRDRDPRFRGAVDRALGCLVDRQAREGEGTGRIGPAGPSLNHIIATMALAEVLGLSKDRERLEGPALAALRHLIASQNPDGGWGSSPGGPSDTPTTAWAVWAGWTGRTALGLAGIAELDRDLDRALANARRFLQGMVEGGTGRIFYRVGEPSTSSHRRFGIPYIEGPAPARAAMALLADLVLGARPIDPLPRALAPRIRKRPPPERGPDGRLRNFDLCSLYFSSYAFFRLGDPGALGSTGRIRDLLLASQRLDGDEEGSWDPIDTWGPVGGRVYATALSALILELSYRYESALSARRAGAPADGTPEDPGRAGEITPGGREPR